MYCHLSMILPLVLVGAMISATSAAQSKNTMNIASRATNTQPCNNYIEFCDRKYSNITEVGAHNSPFSVPGSLSSNQMYDVITQLNDGVRMLEGQTQMLNGTLRYCHTACALLDAGPIEAYFKNVSDWLDGHPNEVVTLVIANSDNSPVTDFVSPIQSSGLGRYVYTPSSVPMALDDWPLLGSLISNGHRAIVFMDYGANQNQVPYILDQYSQLWETPFSPTNANFPCTINRPEGLSVESAKDRLYLANHNLNTNLNLTGLDVLVPDLTNINRTNGASGFGSLGLASDNCGSLWGRPPNFLVVDYYNYGSPSDGSVFIAAAKANGVSYTRSCCGMNIAVESPTSTGGSPATTSTPVTTSSSSITTGPGSGAVLVKVDRKFVYLTAVIALFLVCKG